MKNQYQEKCAYRPRTFAIPYRTNVLTDRENFSVVQERCAFSTRNMCLPSRKNVLTAKERCSFRPGQIF